MPTQLFLAKLELIIRHITNKTHPLRILYENFSKVIKEYFFKERAVIFKSDESICEFITSPKKSKNLSQSEDSSDNDERNTKQLR